MTSLPHSTTKRSWQPKKSSSNSTTTTSNAFLLSPRKSPNDSFSNKAGGALTSEDREYYYAETPRVALFDSKAEIKYTPELDDEAARIYSDRDLIKETKTKMKPGTSGYDFDSLLKGVDVVNPWD